MLVLAINAVMVLALVAVGLATTSLGVLASGADYLGDALGTGVSLYALRLSRRPGGSSRAPSYAALLNASLLLLVTIAVGAEAIYRLTTGAPSIDGLPVVVASLVAAAAMILCAFILGDVEGDHNMESVMLDTVADAAAALGVAASGAVILITGELFWLDSAVALVIALVVGYHAARLIGRVLPGLGEPRAEAPGD